MSEPQTLDLQVSRGFDAPAERVFAAWLDPKLLGQWMFGPRLREEEVVRLELDARIGGSYSFVVRRHGVEFDHVGSYRQIERPTRLAFTWGVVGHSTEESVVTIAIEPRAAGCELTLTHTIDAKWAAYADQTQAGWAKLLASLADVLAEQL